MVYQEIVSLGLLYNVRELDLMENPKRIRRLVRAIAIKSGAKVFGTHIKSYPERGINATADIENLLLLCKSPQRDVMYPSYFTLRMKM